MRSNNCGEGFGKEIQRTVKNVENVSQSKFIHRDCVKTYWNIYTRKIRFRKPTHPDDIKRLGERPLFGCIFAVDQEGVIKRGDEIFAIRVKRV